MDPQTRKEKIPWNITIEPLSIGFIVQVGCKRMAFATMREIVDGLLELDIDYKQAERHYFGNNSPEEVRCEEPRDPCVGQGLVPPPTRLRELSENNQTEGENARIPEPQRRR